MNLSKSIELLKKINDGKGYDKEFNLVSKNEIHDQITASIVLKKIKQEEIEYINNKILELQNSNLYQRKSAIHGKKHIENVMLFAMIISLYENLNCVDQNLLLEAAKYHDQGRDNDLDEQHGIESAYIAGRDLKEKYSQDEIKIIQAAIMFHDDRTKASTLQEIEDIGFDNIVKRLAIKEEDIQRTRRIGNILKDADALDRARFIEDTIPIDVSYLRHKISRKMIKLAMELHEAYSIDELDEIMKNDSTLKIKIQDYLDKISPIRVKEYYLHNIIK